MSMRKYNGSPIDMTWSNGPWANDGETVDATDGDTGTMTTIDWPEGATPREELNEDQIAVIEAAARNQDIDSPKKLNELAGLTGKRTRAYPNSVIRSHWPERYWGVSGKSSTTEGSRSLSNYDVDEVRRRAMAGSTIAELAELYDVDGSTITSALKGENAYSNVDTEYIRALVNTGSKRNSNWVQVETENESGVMQESGNPVCMAETLRKEALDGSSAVEIADKHGFGVTTVKEILKGERTSIDSEIPALRHTTGAANGEWVIQDEHKQETQEQETETETETETEPTLDGQSVSKGYTPQEPTTTDNTKRNAVIATVALLISYLLGKRGGN